MRYTHGFAAGDPDAVDVTVRFGLRAAGFGVGPELGVQPSGAAMPLGAGDPGGRLQTGAGGALRHRIQPPAGAGQYADPAAR